MKSLSRKYILTMSSLLLSLCLSNSSLAVEEVVVTGTYLGGSSGGYSSGLGGAIAMQGDLVASAVAAAQQAALQLNDLSELLEYLESPEGKARIKAELERIERLECVKKAKAAKTQCLQQWSAPFSYSLACNVGVAGFTTVASVSALPFFGPAGSAYVGFGAGVYALAFCDGIHQQYNLSCEATFTTNSAAC